MLNAGKEDAASGSPDSLRSNSRVVDDGLSTRSKRTQL